jgi:hypothetical protein
MIRDINRNSSLLQSSCGLGKVLEIVVKTKTEEGRTVARECGGLESMARLRLQKGEIEGGD